MLQGNGYKLWACLEVFGALDRKLLLFHKRNNSWKSVTTMARNITELPRSITTGFKSITRVVWRVASVFLMEFDPWTLEFRPPWKENEVDRCSPTHQKVTINEMRITFSLYKIWMTFHFFLLTLVNDIWTFALENGFLHLQMRDEDRMNLFSLFDSWSDLFLGIF